MRALRHSGLVLVFFVVVGCGGRRASNVVVTPVQTAPSASVAVAGPQQCQTTLAVGVVQTRAGCQIDERVSGQTAVLSHACGDGPASVGFADAMFQGNVVGGVLDVSIETEFDFTDGCHWRTKQRIEGTLASGALQYGYEERPDPGQSGCARGCLANAQVRAY